MMSDNGAEYVASLLSGITPEELALRMAQSFIHDELHAEVERSELAIIGEDEVAYYVGLASNADAMRLRGIRLRVTKDDPTVEHA